MNLLLQYVKTQKGYLFSALFLALINQTFSLLDPQIFRLIVDNYASKALQMSQGDFFKGVLILLLLSMLVSFISRVAKNFQDYYVSIITQRVGAGLYSHSIEHSFSLPYSAFEDQRSGELLSKLQKARQDAQSLITSFIGIVFLTAVSMVFVISYAFHVSWLIGVTYIFLVPTIGFVQFFLSRRIRQTQKQIVTETASLSGSTTETLRNVELVKSLGLEEQETKRLNAVNEKILSLELAKIKLIRALSFIQGTLINAIRTALLFFLIWLIFKRVITFGEFFTLYIYQFFIFEPLNQLGFLANTYQETKASMEKLQNILDMKSEEKPKNAKKFESIDSLEFRNVGFSYVDEKTTVKDLSFKIEKGKRFAFVGPSGAGKTTVVKLILGLYKQTSGQIMINDTDAKEVDYDHLRKKIGYVSQDTQLFAGTIKENLLFVSPDATDEKCMDALKQSSALSILERGNAGLNTKIGEGGLKISGGERQRLSIARALLRDPGMIIFDEATSSLDSMTEKEITETIGQITKTRPDLIIIMIAHRLSTISHADSILVLERGSLSEEGRHQDLLAKKGLYHALWRGQDSTLAN